MKNANNLSFITQQKKNKRLCKVLAVILVILMFASSSFMMVSAAVSEDDEIGYVYDWGLNADQVNRDYFYSVEHSGLDRSRWSVIRQKCYYLCYNLSNRANLYIVNDDFNKNAIKQLVYCYQNGHWSEAGALRDKWNDIRVRIQDAIHDTGQLVGYGESLPTVNGKEVTTEQYQNLYSSLLTINNDLYNVAKEVSALYTKVKQEEDFKKIAAENPSANSINTDVLLTNKLWSMLGGVIKDFGSGNSSTMNFLGISVSSKSIEDTANMLSSIFKTLAYAVAVILFGVNITTTSLQNEILTLRGGVKVFARVILVKIWIDLAIPICIYVINIFNSITSQIFSQFNVPQNGNAFVNNIVANNTSSTNVFDIQVGFLRVIFETIKTLILGTPFFILFLVTIVCLVIVMVKLVARIFELTCLVAVSPVFFATLVGEETKRYFRKFLSAFLSTAGYIVFVSITYIIASKWVAQAAQGTAWSTTNTFLERTLKVLPCAIIIIACCRVVVKPPKVFTSLLDG